MASFNYLLLPILLFSVSVKCQCFINGPALVVQERRDPKISPHVHDVAGANGFKPEMTYDDTQASTCNTNSFEDDLSNYWTPSLYFHRADGGYELVSDINQGRAYSVYYFNDRWGDDDPSTGTNGKLTAFPPGFRMVTGNPASTTFNATSSESQAKSFTCSVGSPMSQGNELPDSDTWNCDGALRAQIYFPNCWNGELPEDGVGHVVYPQPKTSDADAISRAAGVSGGKCPASHPQRLTQIFYERFFEVRDFWARASEAKNPKQPFVFATGDSTGYSWHGDFLNGWKEGTLAEHMQSCNPAKNEADNSKCKLKSTVDEDIGANGSILAVLPGRSAASPTEVESDDDSSTGANSSANSGPTNSNQLSKTTRASAQSKTGATPQPESKPTQSTGGSDSDILVSSGICKGSFLHWASAVFACFVLSIAFFM